MIAGLVSVGVAGGVAGVDETLTEVLSRHWMDQAACSEYHPDANWQPAQGEGSMTSPRTVRAIEICNGCPVRQACLLFALLIERHKDRGIWGGLSHRERVRLRVTLVTEGRLPILRCCSVCERYFPVGSPNTPRSGLCCSDACRATYRRRYTREPSPV
jgi:WhiB family transcriptional regulator, redox-sensing transcriptional regulator